MTMPDAHAALVALLLLTGCGHPGPAAPHNRARPSKRGAQASTKGISHAGSGRGGTAQVGVVEGTVRVRGEVPVDPQFAAHFEGRVPRPQACHPLTDEERRPVHVGAGGATGGVLVAATFEPSIRPPESVRRNRAITIRDCRMTPRLVAATRGDTLVIRNEDEYPFLPRVNPIAAGLLQAVLSGQSRAFTLDRGGVMEADCGGFGAYCGVASVVVLYHPVHAVSDAQGRFRLDNVPANTDVELHAWHPALHEATAHVRVAPGGHANVDFTLEPTPPRPLPPVADAGTGHPEDQPGTVF